VNVKLMRDQDEKDGWFVVWVFLLILLGIFFTAAVCYLWLLFIWYINNLA
jgi:hypothetical protein